MRASIFFSWEKSGADLESRTGTDIRFATPLSARVTGNLGAKEVSKPRWFLCFSRSLSVPFAMIILPQF